ncbi:hypothetical protein [Colwellia sp. Bg11-28]|nr:hypothetical protein [Colwellia sp. Bg11-28]
MLPISLEISSLPIRLAKRSTIDLTASVQFSLGIKQVGGTL